MTIMLAANREAVLQAIHLRRSVRSYEPDQVPEGMIRALLDAAVQAPTAMHREPWRFLVVQDRALLKRLSDAARDYWKDDAETSAFLRDPAFNVFYDAGTLVAICADPAGGYATADCWLAAQNLMLAATALELGTCVIGLAAPALNLPAIRRELGIPETIEVVAPVIVGFPRGVVPPVGRKPPELLGWIGRR